MMLIYTSRKSECLVTRGIYNKKATSKVAKKHDN